MIKEFHPKIKLIEDKYQEIAWASCTGCAQVPDSRPTSNEPSSSCAGYKWFSTEKGQTDCWFPWPGSKPHPNRESVPSKKAVKIHDFRYYFMQFIVNRSTAEVFPNKLKILSKIRNYQKVFVVINHRFLTTVHNTSYKPKLLFLYFKKSKYIKNKVL